MDSAEIRTLINHFCRMLSKIKIGKADLEGTHIALIRGDGFWDLRAIRGRRPAEAKIWLDFPDWDGKDILDLQIDLAGLLAKRIPQYFSKVKANQSRSSDARKASSQKALDKRWGREKDTSS